MSKRWCKDCGSLYEKESKYSIYCPNCKSKRENIRESNMKLTYEIKKLINELI